MEVDDPLKPRLPAAHYQAITLRNQTQSPLLRLPGELRNAIYEFTMDTHSSTILHKDHQDWDRFHIRLICRQVYSETHDITKKYIKTKLLPLSTGRGVCCPADKRVEVFLSELTPPQKLQIKTLVLSLRHVSDIVKVADSSLRTSMPCLQRIMVQAVATDHDEDYTVWYPLVRKNSLKDYTNASVEYWYHELDAIVLS